MTNHDVWEQQASWWQETFTDGVDAEYEEQILPLAIEHLDGARRVLDVGAGEGQIARLALKHGATFAVGVDRSANQLAEAARREGGVSYVRCDAGALPFLDESFDAAVACLVLEHIDDIVPVINEVSRVLVPGGRFLIFVNHPLLQTPGSGWIDDHILEEQYWRIGPYLTVDTTQEEVEPGVVIPFVHRPLSHYVNPLAEAGLHVTRMVEPRPPQGFLDRAEEYTEASTIPRLLLLRVEKTL